MSKAYLSDTELVNLYDAASDKAKIIDSVAVRCHTTRAAMRERLVKLGCIEEPKSALEGFKPYAPKSVKKHTKEPSAPMDELRAMELFKDGLDDLGMAETLGVSVQRIKEWRSRMHLQRPRGAAAHKKKAKEESVMEQMTDKLESSDAAVVPEASEPMPATAEQVSEAAPPEEAESLLTVSEFLAICTKLLTPAAIKASLLINGVPVRAVEEIRIRAQGGAPCVDIVTEA